MAVEPTFTGEALLRRWSESSTQGVQVTFALSDSAELEPLKAKTGKRFMAVLVEIGDDEQPVPSSVSNGGWSPAAQSANSRSASEKPRERLGDLAWRAVQWCKEPEFQKWVAFRCHCIEAAVGEQEAKEFIQLKCGIESRKELDTNAEAAKLFNQLIRGPYQKHLMARGINR